MRLACGELSALLAKAAGGGAVTVDGRDGVHFHVGDTELARENGLLSSQLADEQWVVRSFGADVVLNGGGSHGALYAVSHFLEDVVGVRFWNDEDTDVPEATSLALPALDLSGRPVFRYRDIYRCGDPAKATPRFAILRRLNRNGDAHVPREWGGEFTYGPPYHCHTFDRMIPWKKYGTEHPEWFSLWEGKRTGGVESGQLCISNPEVRALLLKVLRENIAKGDAAAKAAGVPAPCVYELSMNDSKKYCQCDQCMAEVDKYGFSGFYLNLVNEIADEIAETRPELYFSMLTYLYSEPPPKGGVRPRDNVIVKLCDTRSNQAAPITDPCNGEFFDFLRAWSAIAKNLIVWDYAICFVNPSVFFPFASEFAYADTFRTFHGNNVFGVFIEHEYPYTDMYELKYYLESKLLEDPYQDADAVIDDFMSRYYGAAGEKVLEARRLIDRRRRERKAFVSWFPTLGEFNFISDDDLAELDRIFKAAELCVKGDAKRQRRVERAWSSIARLAEIRRRFGAKHPPEEGVSDKPFFDFPASSKGFALKDGANIEYVQDPDIGDPLAGGDTVVRVKADGDTYYDLPFELGVYDPADKRNVASKKWERPIGVGYQWYSLGRVTLPERSFYLYATRKWTVQLPVSMPGMNGNTFEIKALVKFAGPKFFKDSAEPNEIRIARVAYAEP